MDVRDVARFALTGPAGVFNLTGPGSTMEEFLGLCRDVIGGGPVDLAWVTDEPWLVAQGVVQWTELPLWRTYRGAWAVSSAAAVSAGFVQRGLRPTVADTWAWMNAGGVALGHERSIEQGISPEKESAILEMWNARELGHCG